MINDINKKKEFKFNLGIYVYVLGRPGICKISGRGQMKFISGGKMNYYSLEGGQYGLHTETVLVTLAEASSLGMK